MNPERSFELAERLWGEIDRALDVRCSFCRNPAGAVNLSALKYMHGASPLIRAQLANPFLKVSLSGPAKVIAELEADFHPYLSSSSPWSDTDYELHLRTGATIQAPSDASAFVRMRSENSSAIDQIRSWYTTDAITYYQFSEDGATVIWDGVSSLQLVARTANALRWHAREIIQRQLLQGQMLRRGLMLHAAAVAQDGVVLLLVGPKGAGKTVTQLRLAERGYQLVAADRVFLTCQGPEVEVWGYPGRAAMLEDTLLAFRLKSYARQARRDGQKWLIPMDTVASHFGTTLAANGKLRAIGVLKPMVAETLQEVIFQARITSDPLVTAWLNLPDQQTSPAEDLRGLEHGCEVFQIEPAMSSDEIAVQAESHMR